MCYSPNQHNPNISWDRRGEIVINLIKKLQNSNYRNIAIKVKDGIDDSSYYSSILMEFGQTDRIDILTGAMQEHIGKSAFVIGQFSTAIFEVTYAGIAYYVYEPLENGKTDEMIHSSELFSRSSISRNLEELLVNIKNKTPSVIADREKMFAGTRLSKIDFNTLIYEDETTNIF